MLKNLSLGIVAALALAQLPMSGANLLVNGGFETPVINPSGYLQVNLGGEPGGFGWTVSTNSVDIVENGLFGMTATFTEGVQGLDLIGLGSTGGIAQVINTTPGLTYYLQFRYSDNPFNADASGANFFVMDGFTTLLSGTVTHSNATPGNFSWKGYYGTFIATGTNATVSFDAVAGGGSGGIFLDRVAVDQVPEPSTIVLMGAGLLGLSALRRRKSA